jgi:diguanylate cyclase (GGDEF)-like protein
MSESHKPPAADSFKSRKLKLRKAFLAQLPTRLATARQAIGELPANEADPQRLDDLYVLFHTLKGSGATFGFERLSEVARRVEQAVRTAMDAGGTVTAELKGQLVHWLNDLDALQRAGEALEVQDTAPSFEFPRERPTSSDATDRSRRLIYLCDDDPDFIVQLAGQLGCFGYRALAFSDLAELKAAVDRERPAAIILDIVFPGNDHAGPHTLSAINDSPAVPIPCIFISCRDDFVARLQAVRAGGCAYCTKPIKTVELLEFLDRLTCPHPPEPINVLVVDDDHELAQFHATVLEEAGMVAKPVSDPRQVLRLLETFDADLVLMDMYMPECSGPELSRILRQIPGHVSLPIIYVSSETDVARQHQALSVGADGFLTKPIEPARLVAEINLRAERMRILRSLMVRDGLTGLFNHNAIMQILGVAVANARRTGNPLCFAMIDVDHFKTVNDTYGHPTGDQVLMALSRTLRMCLRDDDVVGRYGGEEFAVILNSADIHQAQRILDALRTSFASVTFFADNHEFHCTFSVGVAAFPTFQRPDEMTEAADRALYRAKHGGRNRVELAMVATVDATLDAGGLRDDAPPTPLVTDAVQGGTRADSIHG